MLYGLWARKIVKALITFVGLPKIEQSDQGSNFTSKLFQQMMGQLDVASIKSSGYHPQSQDALGQFHSRLKNRIRTYLKHFKEWNEGIPFLVFATRESVQESLGLTPFELVFDHSETVESN